MPAFVRALRPRQWIKNLLVAAAPLAAGVLQSSHVIERISVTFGLLCAVSSAGYLINDIRDVDYDRQHPEKSRRPIASGAVSVAAAGVTAALLFLGSFTIAFAVFDTRVGIAVAVYAAVSLSYSFGIKRVPGLELLFVAVGFVIRAVVGGLASDTRLSSWFLVFIGVAALLVVVGKRQSELSRIHSSGQETLLARAALRRYSARYLRGLAWLSAVVAVGAYVMWAATRGIHDDQPVLVMLSAIPLSLSIWRYLQLIAAGEAETPEEALTGDGMIVVSSVVWLLLFASAVALRG